jgi:uncharacterized protein (TIGR02145 family)
MKKTILIIAISIYSLSSYAQYPGTFVDTLDPLRRIYKTVTIGNQVWMAENMSSPFFTVYGDDMDNVKEYGCLYTQENAKEACPTGWHLPSKTEWDILIKLLGGEKVAGGKLKEAGNTHWQNPNYSATGESGFNALPGGVFADPDYHKNSRKFWPRFTGIGEFGAWWVDGESKLKGIPSGGVAYYYWLAPIVTIHYDSDKVLYNKLFPINFKCSVRCVKD